MREFEEKHPRFHLFRHFLAISFNYSFTSSDLKKIKGGDGEREGGKSSKLIIGTVLIKKILESARTGAEYEEKVLYRAEIEDV